MPLAVPVNGGAGGGGGVPAVLKLQTDPSDGIWAIVFDTIFQ
jgi:hypothetical protein